MFPTPAAAAAMRAINDLLAFYGVTQVVWDAVEHQLGSFGGEPRNLAAIPPQILAQAVETCALADGSSLNVVQAAQVGLVWRLARRNMWIAGGGDIAHWIDPNPWETASAATQTTTTSTTSAAEGERKIKLASVIDQGDDSEMIVTAEGTKVFRKALERYVTIMGGPPTEETEPTLEQFLALQRRIKAGHPPYADFAIFVPFARRSSKASRYRSYVPRGDGEYQVRELPGPASLVQWSACFKVYRTALVMLNAVTLASLQNYQEMVERFARRYASCWHLVYAAEDRARAELSARWAHRFAMKAAAGEATPTSWTEADPWEAVFKAIVDDQAYWQEQLHQPALTWLARGGKGALHTPQEEYMATLQGGLPAYTAPQDTKTSVKKRKRAKGNVQRTASLSDQGSGKPGGGGAGKGAGKGNASAATSSGHSAGVVAPSGLQRCFGWNNGNGPCAGLPPGTPCQGKVKRDHSCTGCGSPGHPSKDCPQKKKP